MNKKSVLLFNVDIYLDIEKIVQELNKHNLILHNLDKTANVVCVINDPKRSTNSLEEIQSESFKKNIWEKIKEIPIRIAVTNLFYTLNKGKDRGRGHILKQQIDGKAVYHDVFDITQFNSHPEYVMGKILEILYKKKII